MGITRKTLLVYEEMGLLTPALKDEESGYRYYSADNMTQIRSIRSLQALGLSLKEVAEYYYDTENIDTHLDRLMKLRASLDRNIQILQVRAAKQGDLTVRKPLCLGRSASVAVMYAKIFPKQPMFCVIPISPQPTRERCPCSVVCLPCACHR